MPIERYDGYKELANAIVLQAVEDFRYAVADEEMTENKLERGEISDDQAIQQIRFARAEQKRIRKFFKSGWCEWLCEMDCSSLANRMKKDTFEYLRLTAIALSDPRAKEMTKAVWDEHPVRNPRIFENMFRCPTCGGKVGMTYGFIRKSGKGKTQMNNYGWRVKCAGCNFCIKEEREAIKPKKKGEEKNEKQPC